MNIVSNLVERFERLKGVFEHDYGESYASAYFKDQVLAQIKMIDCILCNHRIHRYTKRGLQSFLMTIKAEDYANSPIISDRCYFIRAFNDYEQMLQNDILYSRIAGIPVTFAF